MIPFPTMFVSKRKKWKIKILKCIFYQCLLNLYHIKRCLFVINCFGKPFEAELSQFSLKTSSFRYGRKIFKTDSLLSTTVIYIEIKTYSLKHEYIYSAFFTKHTLKSSNTIFLQNGCSSTYHGRLKQPIQSNSDN